MQRIEAYGMIAILDPAFVGVKSSDGYFASYLNSSDEVMRAYGAWIGKRFRNYPNVIWSLGGDACPSAKGLYEKLNDLAQGIRSVDPHHMFTLEILPATVHDGRLDTIHSHEPQLGLRFLCFDTSTVCARLLTIRCSARFCR